MSSKVSTLQIIYDWNDIYKNYDSRERVTSQYTF